MNVADAAHLCVHDYPGGSESLAPRMGMSAAVLRNKVNPNNTTHHLTVAEADRMMGITGDLRVLHALAATHGQVVVTPAAAGEACDMAVLEAISALWSRNGDLGSAVHASLADGELTQCELRQIRKAAYAVQQRMATLLERLGAMAEPEGAIDA